MPTYEYQCEKCGLIFEEYQSITSQPLHQCKNKECDGTVKRLFSAGAGFLFKGSGFYITDYRSDSYKKAQSSETKSSPKKETSSTTSSTSSSKTVSDSSSTKKVKSST